MHDLPPQILPLLSQPIIEACLSIPTWAWCEGGENRSVVRQAYRGRLPDVILHRRSKGGPASFAYEVIASQKAFLKDWLGDGMLAAHELLDLPSLNAVLTSSAPLKSPDYMHLLALAEAEAWCRHWSARRIG